MICDKHKALPAFIYRQCVGCELEALRAEVKHWKANHEDLKRRLAFQTQRPDLPVDRIPAYKLMREDIDKIIDAFIADSPLRLAATGDLDAASEYEKTIVAAVDRVTWR